MEPQALRSIWSAETLVGGLAGIHHQPGLLLTKLENDHELQNEMNVAWMVFPVTSG